MELTTSAKFIHPNLISSKATTWIYVFETIELINSEMIFNFSPIIDAF